MIARRYSPAAISKEEFQKAGHELVDKVASLFDTMSNRPVTPGETPEQLQALLGNTSLPDEGKEAESLLQSATDLLFNHSLFNGHPKFAGYITGSPSPAAVLADMLAAAVNPNAGAQILSPIATEIEKQAIRWLADFIGVPSSFGGLFVSGGNMANFTGFLAGRTIKAPKEIKEEGISNDRMKLVVYCSKTTHTWIDKAAVLFGLGKNSIRWIETDAANKMRIDILEQTIQQDITGGATPLMVIGTAGDVSTGAVDDLKAISTVCKKYGLWFHVDGAYGIPAAVVPELKHLFDGIEEADSIALDPHKWLYSPLEAGCTLVKNPQHLIETYSSHPVYYNFDNEEEIKPLNFYEYGFQNSRGFRALKVWLMLQQAGRNGYIKMIGEDIRLSRLLFSLADMHPELEAVSQHLSIATFRYVPQEKVNDEKYLNLLNEKLVNQLQKGGEMFVSNAVVNGKYCLRSCIVNFRTTEKDIEEEIEIVTREGRKLNLALQQKTMNDF